MPPADLVTAGSVASYRPPRTTFTPIPPEPPTSPLAGATAISRSGSVGRFPPPEPPVILPTAPDAPPDTIPPNSRANSGATLTAGANRAGSTATGSSSSTGGSGASGSGSGASGTRGRAPYEPFLNHAPPPVDSWIEVETTQGEYRLIVRLPGFKRDGITLATKKRRILHLVADSWDDSAATAGHARGGGHFERRISFGYDADLAQVRAEFDGEILRVIIPRKAMGMGMGVGTGTGVRA
ncbi:hypothetical protein DFH08DRAFT_700730 [Mycena albidolilacea]|uniref:SHSP domain-containing protein n=1 Tax=Mycena albidolilacea TaxID=1033008 RepID=A0AAD7A0L1_9AGAR|nr:hypothetical protein DFH08DRAFT_700730 [Mycena albidolilacea]